MTDEKMKRNLRSQALLRRERERRRAAYNTVRRVFFSLCAVLAGYLFSGKELPFEVYPLGLALVCSSEKYIAEFTAGVFMHAVLFGHEGLYLPAALCVICAGARYFLVFVLRKTRVSVPEEEKTYLDFFKLEDELSVRVGAASCAGVVFAAARTFSGGTLREYSSLFPRWYSRSCFPLRSMKDTGTRAPFPPGELLFFSARCSCFRAWIFFPSRSV